MKKIAILTPTEKTTPIEFSQFIFLLSRSTSYPLYFIVDTHPNIDISREKLVLTALQNEVDYILFLDSDIIPFNCSDNKFKTANNIIDKWINVLETEDLDVITGIYWLKRNIPSLFNIIGGDIACKEYVPKAVTFSVKPCSGIIKQGDKAVGGLGLTMLKAHIFNNLPKPWFKFKFFSCDGLLYEIGEDIYFYNMLHEHNYKVGIDTDIIGFHEARGFLTWEGRIKIPSININEETL